MASLHKILRKCWRLFPESATERLRGFPPLVAVRNWISQRRWQGASHDEIYDEEYFQFVDRTTKQSAEVIADSIIHAFRPLSVVDVGCGTGALLDSLQARGVRVKGLEYAQAALTFCQARKLDVVKFDVESDELPELENTDLVVSMEVGAQLHEASADRYIDLLCRIAPLVVFSVEAPGGGDKLPRNEQPHRYWIEKFAQRGYQFEEVLSLQWRKDWKQRSTAPWFSRNVDVVLLGLPVSGDEISDYRILVNLPEWRLRIGGYGAFIIIGFVIGVWQLYEGIKSAGAWWSIPPFLLLSYFFISGALFHFLVPFIGAAVKAQAQMQGPDSETMETLVQTMRMYWLAPYIAGVFSLVAGSLWFSVAILFRPTYFPKWMAAFSPLFPIGAAFLITRWLPAPFGGYLLPPFVHFATPLIFGLSTALLWNVKIDTGQRNKQWTTGEM